MNKFVTHLRKFQEGYLWVPIAVLMVVFAIMAVHLSSGRPVEDSPESLVGYTYQFAAVILVCFAVALVKPHVFDDINTTELMTKGQTIFKECTDAGGKWAVVFFVLGRIVIDSLETIFLFVLFAWLVFSIGH